MNLMPLRRLPKWAWGLGAIGAILAVNGAMAFANYVTANPSSCLSCHGTGGTPDMSKASAVHPDYNKVRCVDCHSRSGQYVLVEGYRGGFSADPDRVSSSCQRCHSDTPLKEDSQGFKSNPNNISIPHKLHIQKGALCTDCHQNIAHDLRANPTNRPRMESCYVCHDQAKTSCSQCHSSGLPQTSDTSPIPWTEPVKQPTSTPPAVLHPIEGRSSCLVCHQDGVAGAPKVLESHAGRTNEVCTSCHQAGVAPRGSVTPLATTSIALPTTTKTTAPATGGPPNIPHPLDGRSACLACHEAGLMGAPKVPQLHVGRTNDICTACHTAAK
ncbi:MAG: NapC/NirT family cytochrome c [Chloroflexi bacterium]|nr:NapC/NirT family cytochrome c [Chloroflexota bacterium]